MKVVVLSDIHGNLPAFEKVLGMESGADLYVSLGDVVNYGPWSNECVDLLESLNAVKLKGNHEDYFLAGAYPGKSPLVQSFFKKCTESFDRTKLISKYREEQVIGKFNCRHTIADLYLYPASDISADGNYFIGHSHHQFDRKGEKFHVVNVGSVGQNRKEINVINYVLYETDTDQIEMKAVIGDISSLVQKMKELKYPKDCISYYLSKPVRLS